MLIIQQQGSDLARVEEDLHFGKKQGDHNSLCQEAETTDNGQCVARKSAADDLVFAKGGESIQEVLLGPCRPLNDSLRVLRQTSMQSTGPGVDEIPNLNHGENAISSMDVRTDEAEEGGAVQRKRPKPILRQSLAETFYPPSSPTLVEQVCFLFSCKSEVLDVFVSYISNANTLNLQFRTIHHEIGFS